MTTVDSLYNQLNLEKTTVEHYNRLAETSIDDPFLKETLLKLKNNSHNNIQELENTIQHVLEKEIW